MTNARRLASRCALTWGFFALGLTAWTGVSGAAEAAEAPACSGPVVLATACELLSPGSVDDPEEPTAVADVVDDVGEVLDLELPPLVPVDGPGVAPTAPLDVTPGLGAPPPTLPTPTATDAPASEAAVPATAVAPTEALAADGPVATRPAESATLEAPPAAPRSDEPREAPPVAPGDLSLLAIALIERRGGSDRRTTSPVDLAAPIASDGDRFAVAVAVAVAELATPRADLLHADSHPPRGPPDKDVP